MSQTITIVVFISLPKAYKLNKNMQALSVYIHAIVPI